MPSPFDNIGFPIRTADEFFDLAEQAAAAAERVDVALGHYLVWRGDSRAELWLQLDREGEFIGMSPHFAGTGRVPVRLTRRVTRPEDTAMDGGFHAWANPNERSGQGGDYPFVFDAPDYMRHVGTKVPGRGAVQVAAFPFELDVYDSLEEYEASQPESVHFAPRSFIPSGLFQVEESEEPPQAHAAFSGHVAAVERRTNELTGRPFHWVLVESLGGTFDVVADPALLEETPMVGGIVTGSFWLSGRLADAAVEAPSSS